MKLGITGHLTRGNEVIEILEMLGGKNCFILNGDKNKYFYYIGDKYKDISYSYIGPDEINGYKILSLDDFLEKYPFKVGDFVGIPEYESEVRINAMKWDVYSETVLYMVHRVDEEEWYTTEELLDYNDIEDYKNIKSKNIKSNKEETITIDDFKANTKEWLIDKLESMSKDNALQAICNLYDELHKPKYPKTFIEVLDFWHPNRQPEDDYQGCYKKDLIEKFQDLLYARDAYWKIAGEEMGLGKPWELYHTQKRYVIRRAGDKIIKSFNVSCVLEFPTVEMRDAFYNNFKDLIEQCKELL